MKKSLIMISFNRIQRSIINYVRSLFLKSVFIGFHCFYVILLEYINGINKTYSDIITIRNISVLWFVERMYTKSIEKFVVDLGTELLYFWTLKRVTSHFSTFSFASFLLYRWWSSINRSVTIYQYEISNQMMTFCETVYQGWLFFHSFIFYIKFWI